MSVKQAGEISLPPELFTKEHIHGICHLHAHASLLAVVILNAYKSLLEFASDSDVAQTAQNLEKVTHWHEVPITMACTTSSDKNQLECISRERQGYPAQREEVEQEFHERQNAQQAMIRKMIKDFIQEITRLGAVQAAQIQLTVVLVPQVEGCTIVTPTGSWNWQEVNPAPPV